MKIMDHLNVYGKVHFNHFQNILIIQKMYLFFIKLI